MTDAWISRVKHSAQYKIRVTKKYGHWFLLMPSNHKGERQVIRFPNWDRAHRVAMRIQDERNSPS